MTPIKCISCPQIPYLSLQRHHSSISGKISVIPCQNIHGCSSSRMILKFVRRQMDSSNLIQSFHIPFVRQYQKKNIFYAWTKMIISFCICLLIFLQNVHVVRSEVYSSASDMKSIFRMEMDLANNLNDYAKKMQLKLDRVNKYIQVC